LEINKVISDYNGFGISCFGIDDGSITVNVTSGDAPYLISWTGPDGFVSDQPSIANLFAGEYILNIIDLNLCTVIDTTYLTEPGQIAIDAILSESDFGGYNVNCFGDLTGTIEIQPVNSVGSTRYFWTDGEQGYLRENLGAGSYGIMIVDDNNCSKDSIITLIEPEPVAFTYIIDDPYCVDMPDGTITLLPTGGVIISDYNYLWWDNSTGSSVSSLAAGNYEVMVTDANGCSLSQIIKVTSERESCITIPNAISPNGDGINEEWNIDLLNLYPDVEIKIFNRWGEMVWASERGYPNPWDGTSKGRNLPIDSYHYIINLNNGTKPILGNVTIIR
jgi:gliding motility-associated-like protein